MRLAILLLLTMALSACSRTKTVRLPPPATEPEQPMEQSTIGEDSEPEPIGGLAAIQAALRQPEEVWRDNKSGLVVVEAEISSAGRVVATRVAQSSGYTGMDSEAMLAVSRVAWKPARKKGVAVGATVRVPVRFETNR